MIKLQAGERTDVGRLRTENEDSVWAQVLDQPGYAPIGLFIVCDGMGGHMGGKYASYWAVEAIKSEFGSTAGGRRPAGNPDIEVRRCQGNSGRDLPGASAD